MRKKDDHNDPWRDHFQRRFEDFEAAPPPFERIKRPRPLLFWWRSGVGILVLLLGGFWMADEFTEHSFLEIKPHQSQSEEQSRQCNVSQKLKATRQQGQRVVEQLFIKHEALEAQPTTQSRQNKTTTTVKKELDHSKTAYLEARKLPKRSTKIKVDTARLPLKSLDLSELPLFMPTRHSEIATQRISSVERKSLPRATWRLFATTDAFFWHLKRNPVFVASHTEFSSNTIPSLQDRFSGSFGVSATRPIKGRWAAYGQVSYRYVQEKMDYTVRETVVADFRQSTQNETSAFPRFPKTETKHRRNVHLLGLGTGLVYQITQKQHMGGGLQIHGILPSAQFDGKITVSGDVFYRYRLTHRIAVAPTFTYFFHQTTPKSANIIGRPYGFGLRLGWKL